MNELKEYHSMVSFRKNWWVCPLPLAADTYANCEYGCPMCYCRDLDCRIWKAPFRPGTLENFKKAFKPFYNAGLTLKLGSKSDPYPTKELSEQVTRDVLKYLKDIGQDVIVNTRSILFLRDLEYFNKLMMGILLPPKMKFSIDKFESKMLPRISARLEAVDEATASGIEVCINAEPLLPLANKIIVRNILNEIADSGAKSINFYSFNFTKYFIESTFFKEPELLSEKDLNELYEHYNAKYIIEGKNLIECCKEIGLKVGAPDWVNFPWNNDTTTCCGFNIDTREKLTLQEFLRILKETGEIKFDDVIELASEYDKQHGHVDTIFNKWGALCKSDYFLEDVKGVFFEYENGDRYVKKEIKEWW